MDNGAELYHRFLAGDDGAFGEIIALYRENLIFFINRYVANLYAAEDIAADCFLELLVHKDRYDGRASLKTYLYIIGKSRAVDYLRKHSRVVSLDGDNYGDSGGNIDYYASEREAFDERLIADGHKRALNLAMERLKPEYRAVLHLVFFENMSIGEAAVVMKKNKKQAENLLFRAKASLKGVLEKDFGDWL